MVDLGPAPGRLDRPELARRCDRVLRLGQRAVGAVEQVHRPAPEVGEVARSLVVVVALIGRHLGAREDQLARVVGLVAADLADVGDVVVVVDQGHEVEPGAALADRPEAVVEGLLHRRVARLLLAVGVEVADVPAGLRSRPASGRRGRGCRDDPTRSRPSSSRPAPARRRRLGRPAAARSRPSRAPPPTARPATAPARTLASCSPRRTSFDPRPRWRGRRCRA